MLTDAIIYRSLASDFGRLPPEVIRRVVTFYSLALDTDRVVVMATSEINAYETIRELMPKLQMNAEVLVAVLDKWEKADYVIDADLTMSLEEMKELARPIGYPLNTVLKARGSAPG